MRNIIAITIAAVCLTACMNDWDTEMVATDVMTAESVGEPNTTIAEVRTRYAKVIESGATSEAAKCTENLIIEGIVVANDISGNIYQGIYIQDVNSDGTLDTKHGGIQVAIKGIGSLAAVFPVGQKVRINLNGLCISGYGKMPRIGQPYVNTNGKLRHGPMPPSYVKTNIELVGTPYNNTVVAHELTSAELASGNIDALTPMLVVMHGCTIQGAGGDERYAWVDKEDPNYTVDDSYSVTHSVILSDGYKKKDLLYTSTSATFAMEVIPEGRVTIYGILGRYNNDFQLILRSVDDVVPEK